MTGIESLQPVLSASLPSGPVTPGRLEQRTLTSIGGIDISPPPAAERNRAVLIRMDAMNAGQVIALDGAEFGLGRHPGNAMVLDDEGISRHHARIRRSGDRYVLEDLGSSNGTYVNGARTASCELTDGALIQMGPRIKFRFSVLDENQERILRQLYESSVRDSLTGAYNRNYFMERMSGELAYANRHGSNASVLLLDLDFFKRVNDTFGHPAGDEVLRGMTRTLQHVLRTEDVFARYGGEEFIVLLRGTAIDGAARAAERLRSAVQATPVEYEGRLIEVTVSIGCASLSCVDARGAEALVATADRRLYAAKRSGRNRVVSAG